MILGLSVASFTVLHVIISLIAIAAGFVALGALITRKWLGGWQQLFLATTILTSVTGFFFPLKAIGPPHVFGVISLVLLAVSLLALYRRRAGVWAPVYALTALVALYLNCVVLVVQSFQKLPPLNAFAPTGSEPPVLAAQALTLAGFVVFGLALVRPRRPAALTA